MQHIEAAMRTARPSSTSSSSNSSGCRGLSRRLILALALLALLCASFAPVRGDDAAPATAAAAAPVVDTAAAATAATATDGAAARGANDINSAAYRAGAAAAAGGDDDDSATPTAAAGRAGGGDAVAAAAAALADPEAAADGYFAALAARARALRAAGAPLPAALALADAALQRAGEGANADGTRSSTTSTSSSSGAALARLRRNFIKSVKRVAELNAEAAAAAGNLGIEYGLNDFSHLDDRQFERLYLLPRSSARGSRGARSTAAAAATAPEAPDASLAVRDAGAATTTTTTMAPLGPPIKGTSFCPKWAPWASTDLPANPLLPAIDWRTSDPPLVTPVKSQGRCGSCVAFANLAAVEAAYIASRRAAGDVVAAASAGPAGVAAESLSVQEAISCTKGDTCRGTINGFEFAARAACDGAVLDSNYAPYAGVDNDACRRDAPRVDAGIAFYTTVPAEPEGFRKALAHGVVSTIVSVDLPRFRHYKRGLIGCQSRLTHRNGYLNHAVAIVAYSDSLPVTSSSAGSTATAATAAPAFTIKNSWGTRWGEAGYFSVAGDCPASGLGPLAMHTARHATLPVRRSAGGSSPPALGGRLIAAPAAAAAATAPAS